MRRALYILLIAAFLFSTAAYGSKKSRVSTASASQKKTTHEANRAAGRKSAYATSTRRHSRSRHIVKAAPATRPHRSLETATPPDPTPVIEPASLTRSRFVMPPPLLGSHDSLVRQNEKSEADNLERIEDDDDLNARIAGGMLVPVPVSAALAINGGLPENRRYCRPWTASFLADLARAHAARFHAPLQVTSAVRTVEYQKRLQKTNGNATSAEGEIASPHLTGATIDIAKQGLSRQQIAWMRDRLLPLQDAGKIDVEEEFQQSCFHITVYKSYVPPKPTRNISIQASAAQAPAGQGQTVKIRPRQPKLEQRKPEKPNPAQSSPEEPRQQPSTLSQSEAPVEGL